MPAAALPESIRQISCRSGMGLLNTDRSRKDNRDFCRVHLLLSAVAGLAPSTVTRFLLRESDSLPRISAALSMWLKDATEAAAIA